MTEQPSDAARNARLAQLHAELDAAHRQDPGRHPELDAVLPALEQQVRGPAGAPADSSLGARLEALAVYFEADHPKLAASARQLIDLLYEVGI